MKIFTVKNFLIYGSNEILDCWYEVYWEVVTNETEKVHKKYKKFGIVEIWKSNESYNLKASALHST